MNRELILSTTDDIRDHFVEMMDEESSFTKDKTGQLTLEIIGAQFETNQLSIFGKPNYDYIAREIEWYKLQSRNINYFPGGAPKIWGDVANYHGHVNSDYGWCVYDSSNYSQFKSCLEELDKNPDSRRAVMIYTRPMMQTDYMAYGMSDFVCTNVVQYFIRDSELISYVQMRSCDAIFGYPNDLAWQTYVQQDLANELQRKGHNVINGPIIWNCGSLHIYERHFYLLQYYKVVGEWNVDKREAKRWYENQLESNG